MAEKTDKQLCSICLNDYIEPKILDCRHSFCCNCLEDYIHRTEKNNQFVCPLCRQEVNIPEGGVREFTANLDIEQSLVTAPDITPKCEVCNGGVNSEFKCRDCEQYLCGSCRKTHDSLKICKDHVVVDVSDVMDIPRDDNSDYTDVCSLHRQKKAKCYCKDCQATVCGDCFVSYHLRHSYLELQDDKFRQETTEELKSLNTDLGSQVAEFQNYTDSLIRLLTDINTSSETACQNVDKQVDEICCKVKTLAEDVKLKIQKKRDEADNKLTKLKDDMETLIEDIHASRKCSGNIIDDRCMEQIINRIPQVQQEKEEGKKRKLEIPDVSHLWFRETEIDEDMLVYQFGHLEKRQGPTFTTRFNFDDEKLQSGGECDGDDFYIQGLPWCIGVGKLTEDSETVLDIYLELRTTDTTIELCQAKSIIKLINFKDKHQSVEGQDVEEGDKYQPFASRGWPGFIDCKFCNNQDGFLDDNNSFLVQMTVKVLDIKETRE